MFWVLYSPFWKLKHVVSGWSSGSAREKKGKTRREGYLLPQEQALNLTTQPSPLRSKKMTPHSSTVSEYLIPRQTSGGQAGPSTAGSVLLGNIPSPNPA
jgi:hypothetical protein